MIVACVALLVALGGTSIAAVSQALPRNSVGTPQLRNNAVTAPKIANNAVVASKIRDNAVVRRKIANNAITSAQVQNGSLLATDFAEGQIPQGPQGPQGPAGPAGPAGTVTRLTAVVNAAGSLARSQGTTSAGRLGEGTYEVIFNQDVSNCTYVATLGNTGSGPTATGEIAVAGRTGNANGVFVATRDSSGTLADRSFHLIVVC
jgi:hypothetical protein